MAPVLATHLRSEQMSEPGPSSPFCSGKEATNQGSRLGEHGQAGDRKKPRCVTGAGKQIWAGIMHTSWRDVKLHKELKRFHFWNSAWLWECGTCFESGVWQVNKLPSWLWGKMVPGWLRHWNVDFGASPAALPKQSAGNEWLHREQKPVTAVVESFLIWAYFLLLIRKWLDYPYFLIIWIVPDCSACTAYLVMDFGECWWNCLLCSNQSHTSLVTKILWTCWDN